MPKQQPPKHRLIAYIDFLGFKEIIKEKPNFCLTILKKVKNIKIEAIRSLEKSKKDRIKYSNGDKQVSIFSDLLVISYPFDAKNTFNFERLCAEVGLFLQPLLAQGVIARGVITLGSLFHKEDIIFGEALIEAYQMEQRIVKYPRIIISDSLIQKMCQARVYSHSFYDVIFSRDSDGFRYLDLFKLIEFHSNDCSVCKDESRPYLKRVKNRIISNLKKLETKPDAISKWRWIANTYNQHLIAKKIKNISQIDY